MRKYNRLRVSFDSNYTPITDNIYHDGSSYRVRVRIKGEKFSKNFSNKRHAIAYRNLLWKSARISN